MRIDVSLSDLIVLKRLLNRSQLLRERERERESEGVMGKGKGAGSGCESDMRLKARGEQLSLLRKGC